MSSCSFPSPPPLCSPFPESVLYLSCSMHPLPHSHSSSGPIFTLLGLLSNSPSLTPLTFFFCRSCFEPIASCSPQWPQTHGLMQPTVASNPLPHAAHNGLQLELANLVLIRSSWLLLSSAGNTEEHHQPSQWAPFDGHRLPFPLTGWLVTFSQGCLVSFTVTDSLATVKPLSPPPGLGKWTEWRK